jgi:uncharacterized transporter YbjL
LGEPLQIRSGVYPEKPSDGNTTIRDDDLVAFTGSRQPAAQVCSELGNRNIHPVSVQMICLSNVHMDDENLEWA